MRFYLYLTILIISFNNEIRSQTETCLQNLNHPDLRIISQEIGTNTITREYILNIPSNYDENIPIPLIINMHGFGDCASEYSETIGNVYNFSELANEENIIVVYPQGAYRPEKEDTYWEPGDNGIENIYENDSYFIDELISNIQAEFNINPDMIYACGYSNGGMMAYSLACNRSNHFSAIGIMSGTMLQENCNLEKPIPIIKFHGIADEVLPYNGNIWYQSVDEVVSFWLDQNGISPNSLNSSQLNEGRVVLDEYSGGNNNSCFSLYTINEEFDKPGGHVWFSEEIEGTTPNEIVWNFFKEKCGTLNSTNESNEELLRVYPNPFRNRLIIENGIHKDYSIYSMDGKLVKKGTINSDHESVYLNQLQTGFFTIKIESEVKKLIKIE